MKISEATILIADDEPELLEIFAIWMGRTGAKVLKAPNGAEALKLVQAGGVDALISDIRMPVMDGITLVRRIHELRLLVPSIIFVSGFGDVDPRELYSLGVEAMLAKPLARGELLRSLEHSLLEREARWLQPPIEQADQTLTAEFASLDQAMEDHSFGAGRGGCCLAVDRPFHEGLTRFSIHFAAEDQTLSGFGRIRWCDVKDGRVGIEFEYLEPECRAWVMGLMQGEALLSFIPGCTD